ncbi:unnamed protein product [Fusarium fujikuroi]|nr:unnamed protein product [Fusarium fujikuroi]
MCFLFTDPKLLYKKPRLLYRTFTNFLDSIDDLELQSANLNMDKKRDTLSEKEASPNCQRFEPRDFKDLTGHIFGTIPPDFKPVLTIPWSEHPDQGISELAADLTIIERFTTVTQSEQSITTSIPRRLTPGTEIEIVTIIDGTKFVPPSSTSDVTGPSQESEHTSLRETTTEVLSLSTETTLLAPSSYRSSEGRSWTTSYTTDSSTELLPPSSSPIASETSESNMDYKTNHDINYDKNCNLSHDMNRDMDRTPPPVFDFFPNLHEHLPNCPIVQIMENQEISASHGADPSSTHNQNGPRELVDLTGSVYSTVPSGFGPVLAFLSEDLPGKYRENVTVIDKVDGTSIKDGAIIIGTETWEPFTWYTRHKHETFTLVLRPTDTTRSDNDILSIISNLTLPSATPTSLSEKLTSSSSTTESLAITTAESSSGSLSAGGWTFVFVIAMAVPFPDSEYIDEAQTQSPGLKTTENEDLEHEVLSYFLNEPRIFIDSLGHTYSDMKSNQEPYSTYAKIVTIPRTKVQEPMTFTSRHTITLTSMATLTSFTTVFETKHLGPVDPLPKVTSKITTHITITVVKDHSISSARTSLPTTDLSPLFPPSVDANTDPSLWSTVTISDSIRSSSVLPSSFTTSRDGPKLPTGTEASSSKDSLTAGEVAPIAVGVLFLLATICLIIWFWLRSRRKRKGTSRGTRLSSRPNPTPSNSP